MMDALIPAVEAIQNCLSEDIKDVLNAGAEAALVGAQSTINLKANFGRARNYGERSIGYMDSVPLPGVVCSLPLQKQLRKVIYSVVK